MVINIHEWLSIFFLLNNGNFRGFGTYGMLPTIIFEFGSLIFCRIIFTNTRNSKSCLGNRMSGNLEIVETFGIFWKYMYHLGKFGSLEFGNFEKLKILHLGNLEICKRDLFDQWTLSRKLNMFESWTFMNLEVLKLRNRLFLTLDESV